ncbi:MAG: hypothetical protein WKF58_07840 [Ilumatobacteraceae bacterium]
MRAPSKAIALCPVAIAAVADESCGSRSAAVDSQTERVEQLALHVRGVRLARHGLDDETEHRVPDVRVLEALVARQHVGAIGGQLDQSSPCRGTQYENCQ